jgi:hypothetical protein
MQNWLITLIALACSTFELANAQGQATWLGEGTVSLILQ